MKSTLVFISFWVTIFCNAQSLLTGKWVGSMGDDQYLEINLLQKGRKLCGYTFDSVFFVSNNFCKTTCEGEVFKFDSIEIYSVKMFEQGYSPHSKMKFLLKYANRNGVRTLEGYTYSENYFGFFLKKRIDEFVYLEQVSTEVPNFPSAMNACFPEKIKKKKEENLNQQNAQPIDTPSAKKIDMPIIISPTDKENDYLKREYKQQKIKTNSTDSIQLEIYDNATIDGDTISLYVNKQLVVEKQKLTEKPLKLKLAPVKEGKDVIIDLIAHNLGDIPPNTALCIVKIGNRRYEIFTSADLKTNAQLIIKYEK